MDLIHHLYEFIQKGFEFLFWGVLVGYVIKRWIGDQVIKYGRRWASKNERNTAIWFHYWNQLEGHGHATDTVLDCHEDRCRVFTQYV